MVRIMLSVSIGVIAGFTGGLTLDRKFHPDYFILGTLISLLIIFCWEIRRVHILEKTNESENQQA
ncbi:hypothetical protein [Salirhabdus salicampi]|uniref:hypothetical protein n=1 Tax=Salirhabdus salicampi TaxID=476102 RepID=UPI0020C4F871|nr:hypothetical protein [Salirhabdus salicampi]MCP8615977.1 hypothetical protein [Salirhabdus salicampi]